MKQLVVINNKEKEKVYDFNKTFSFLLSLIYGRAIGL